MRDYTKAPRYCRQFRSVAPAHAIPEGSERVACCSTAGRWRSLSEAVHREVTFARRRRSFEKERIAARQDVEVAQRPEWPLLGVSKRRRRAGSGTQAAL